MLMLPRWWLRGWPFVGAAILCTSILVYMLNTEVSLWSTVQLQFALSSEKALIVVCSLPQGSDIGCLAEQAANSFRATVQADGWIIATYVVIGGLSSVIGVVVFSTRRGKLASAAVGAAVFIAGLADSAEDVLTIIGLGMLVEGVDIESRLLWSSVAAFAVVKFLFLGYVIVIAIVVGLRCVRVQS